MAYVRDSDTSLWLHNKLGTNDLWSSHSICSQLDRDLLGKIPQIFPDLQSQVKLKLILAIIHIPLRNMVEWSTELKAILVKASQDTDPWVAMLSDLLRTYPDDGQLFLDPDTGGFCELLNELRKLIRNRSTEQVLPEECLYLNKSASTALLGQPPNSTKYFNLRKNPKSYQLKNEYVSKARESQNTKRAISNSSVPIRYRNINKMDGPLRGLPSNRSASGSFRSPISSLNRSLSKTPNRKEPGIKFLEFGEMPLGKDAKRRKLKSAEEEGNRKDDTKKDDEKIIVEEENDGSLAENTATPDYAAGLLSSMPAPSPAAPTPSYGAVTTISKVPASLSPKTLSHTPQYANIPGTSTNPQTSSTATTAPKFSTSTQGTLSQPTVDSRPSYAASALLSNPSSQKSQTTQPISQPQSVVVQGQTYTVQTQQGPFNTRNRTSMSSGSVYVTTPGSQSTNAPNEGSYEYLLSTNTLNPGSNGAQYVIRQAPQIVQGAGLQPVSMQPPQVGNLQQVQASLPNGSRVQRMLIQRPALQVQNQAHQSQEPITQQQQQQEQVQQRNYQISQSQFNEAQEMFKNSNKVTRSEKALILGFIAGKKENPCPSLGDVITIILNEERRIVQQPDGSTQVLLVQTHFEMNYRTGDWAKVIRQFPEGQSRTQHVIVNNAPAK